MNTALNEHNDEFNDGIWTQTLEMLAVFYIHDNLIQSLFLLSHG